MLSFLTETRVFNMKQRSILLSENVTDRGQLNPRKTQSLAKVVQYVWYTTVSSLKLNSVRYRVATYNTLTDSLHIFVIIAQTYAGLFQVIVTIEHCQC